MSMLHLSNAMMMIQRYRQDIQLMQKNWEETKDMGTAEDQAAWRAYYHHKIDKMTASVVELENVLRSKL